jgi:hypothetical protein
MNHKRLFCKANTAGFVLGAAFLATLTGCIGYVEQPRGAYVYAAPPVVETTVVVEDDYVYYPNYEVYYSSSRHQYAYLEGGAWISRPAPHGVSVEVLLASPSVRMDFHDAPARHHAEIVRQYPRNWAPSGSNRGGNENRRDDKRDERRENSGK